MDKNPIPNTVHLVCLFSILFGTLLFLSGFGAFVAQILNYGSIQEYTAAINIVIGIPMLASGIYLYKGYKFSRNLLELSLWAALFYFLLFTITWDKGFNYFVILASLQFIIPISILIYGTRSSTIRNYAKIN